MVNDTELPAEKKEALETQELDKKVKKSVVKPKKSLDKEKIVELTDLLQRVQANFENYRKQQEKRFEEIQQMAAKGTILPLLPLLDNFELALKNTGNHEEFVKGIELIYSQLTNLLESLGIKKIIIENQKFDPYYHEALLKVESEFPEGTILEEFQKGFTLHDKVIRHAKVKVSAGKKSDAQITQNKNNHLGGC